MLCEVPSVSRRTLIGGAGALFAWAYMPKLAFASGNRDARFVCIVLRGALDGLSAVAPAGDPDYAGLHGSLALAASGLGDPFKKTSTYDAADYYKPEDDMSGYEDDNNEPV